MKKSILFSLMVIGAVAALITAATTATFSDTVTSNGNTFHAGTLLLSVDGDCGTTGTPTARTAGSDTPCAHGTATFTTATNIYPGAPASTHDYAVINDGSLDGLLSVTRTLTSSDETNCPAATNWTISAPVTNQTLNDGGTYHYIASVALNSTAGNGCQGVTATLNITFQLDQNPVQS